MKPITLWTVRFVGNVTKKLFLKEDTTIEVVGLTRTQIRCLSSLQSPAVSCSKYFCQHCAEKTCIQPVSQAILSTSDCTSIIYLIVFQSV